MTTNVKAMTVRYCIWIDADRWLFIQLSNDHYDGLDVWIDAHDGEEQVEARIRWTDLHAAVVQGLLVRSDDHQSEVV